MKRGETGRLRTDAFDVVVIGGGTGGYAAALRAAQLGKSVALVERDLLGGTCLHRGCIPTKALLHAAEVYDTVRSAERFGVRVDGVALDFQGVVAHKSAVVGAMHRGLESLVAHRKIALVAGEARVAGPNSVAVGDRSLEAGALVVATGSTPKMLPGLSPGERVLTSDEALTLDRVPASAIVIGAGSVGVEFASIWASFGTSVTVVEMLPALLPAEDADASAEIARAFSKRGIRALVGAKLDDLAVSDDEVRATVVVNGKSETLAADVLLVAVGRAAVTTGLEAAGITVDERGFVTVTDGCEAGRTGVYAVGDVLATPQLAHVAFAEGILAAEHLAGRNPPPINYAAVPRCTYSFPEVASVGLTESGARELGHDVVTKVIRFTGIGKAAILGETAGLCKVVAAADGPILGVHLVGTRVTELAAEAMLAVGWEAVPDEVAALLHPHPTLTESFGEAALALAGKALHTP